MAYFKLLAFVAIAAVCKAAVPVDNGSAKSATKESCRAVFATAGVPKSYAKDVAHVLHSITLQDLREFFKPDAPEQNGIPNINLDLASEKAILFNAPDSRGPDYAKFRTPGMRLLDRVLRHLGDESWGVKGFDTLHKIIHAFHMRELFTEAADAYRRYEEEPPSSELCACASDREASGLWAAINELALEMREPGLMATRQSEYALAPGWHGTWGYQRFRREAPKPGRGRWSSLETPGDWERLKEALIPKDGEMMAQNAALFLYCALN